MFYFLLMLYLIEIILGGGGTIFSYRGVSIRQILYLVLVLGSFVFFKRKIDSKIYKISILYLFILSLNVFLGILNKADIELILVDLKTFIGLFILLPLAIFLKNKEIEESVNVLENSILLLGLFYFILNLIFKVLDENGILEMYKIFSNIGKNEFFITRDRIFYKSIVFLNIGLIFSFLKKNKIKFLFYFILIYLSKTRGFYVGILLTFLVNKIVIQKYTKKSLYLTLINLIVLSMLTIFNYRNLIQLFLKPVSDLSRFIQIQEVVERVHLKSFLIGHGFGVGIPSRPIHLEIAYLEIFHKQGILGILFWLVIIVFQTKLIIKNQDSPSYKNLLGLYLGSCFIYFQSLTNPYISNPIGMTFIFLSLVCLINENNQQNLTILTKKELAIKNLREE